MHLTELSISEFRDEEEDYEDEEYDEAANAEFGKWMNRILLKD